MSFVGFLKFLIPVILDIGIPLLLIIIFVPMIRNKYVKEEKTKKIVNTIAFWVKLALSVSFLVFFVQVIVTNAIPKQGLDHTSVDQQNKQYEQTHLSPTPIK